METADWQIEIFHRKEDMAHIEALFFDEALALACFELDEKANQWRSSVFLAEKPDEAGLAALLTGFEFSLQPVQQHDWVAQTQANFPPRRIGRFLILGSHHHGISEAGSIPLYLDAGAAFGTGEHATTEGCLLALEWVAKKELQGGKGQEGRPVGRPSHERDEVAAYCGAQHFTEAVVRSAERLEKKRGAGAKILDMGCGSGILGIAAAKRIVGATVLGVEIDAVATAVAAENVKRNKLAARCRMVTGNGYDCPQVTGQYDIIFANILAAPLVKFAPMLKQHLAVGGYAILSGLLTTQAHWVLSAHRAQGLALVRRIEIGDWTTLVVKR